MPEKENMKSGFVVIVGKPNVGKSVILNWFINQKIAIVSSKPETTRNNIRGILTTENVQIVFIDTPGIHKAHLTLGKEMVKKAKSSLADADLILLVVDAVSGIRTEDERLFEMVSESKIPAIVLLNKVDIIKRSKLLPMIKDLSTDYKFLEIIPVSALRGDNMEVLKEKVIEYLPKGQKYYTDGEVTDQDLNFQISELIREKILQLTHHEVPHSIAVVIEELIAKEDKGKDSLFIKACIYVERDSQKGIIVGRSGKMIKEIRTLARKDIRLTFNKKVFLEVWVKVLKNWRSDSRAIKRLGLER